MLDDIENQQLKNASKDKPEHIRELLAEATGVILESDSSNSTPAGGGCFQPSRQATPAVKERSLAEKVQAIFNLESAEYLRAEWSCYIVRSAIVPGYMYLTDQHVCFYASLPSSQV
ncbi:hypothetical protein DFQ30_006649 [Apophysomyces sp. BC1015]|nr:hypothetical protein DFQ30_006649 [Apophysomyces sp. BC1015]